MDVVPVVRQKVAQSLGEGRVKRGAAVDKVEKRILCRRMKRIVVLSSAICEKISGGNEKFNEKMKYEIRFSGNSKFAGEEYSSYHSCFRQN